MEYSRLPSPFPEQSQAIVEAARLRARQQLEKDRKQVAPTEYGPGPADEENLRRYILRVFQVFAKEACKLGLVGTWTVEQIRHNTAEFLRLFTIEAYYEDGHDYSGRKVSPMVSHINGAILPEVLQKYRESAQWHRHERELLRVANAQGNRTRSVKKQPLHATVQGCAKERKAMIVAYQREVLDRKGTKIPQKAIWKAAGYETRTEGERWMRCDPKRINKSADANIMRVLREKPHLK